MAENNTLADAVVRLKSGDGEAFRQIYDMTSKAAYFTALKIVKNEQDAEDVLQESYMIVLDKIGDVTDPDSFTSWFNKTVANKAKEILRKNNKYLFVEKSSDGEDEGADFFENIEEERAEFNPGVGAEQEELKRLILDMIDSLSDEKRTVVLLYYYSEMSIKEIAESLGVNENTVKSRLYYAKKDLSDAVRGFEKKHGRLLGIAPVPIIIWALRSGSASASASFIASGASAAAYAAVGGAAGSAAAASGTASVGAAAAATGAVKLAAAGIAQKVAIGIAAAAIIGGTTAGVRKLVKERPAKESEPAAFVETISTRAVNESLEAEETSAEPPTEEVGTEAETTAETAETTSAAASARQTESAEREKAGKTTGRAKADKTTSREKVTETTVGKSTEAVTSKEAASTETTTRSTPQTTAAQVTTTATPTTAAPTTTKKQTATVNVTITQGGTYAGSTAVTLNDGDVFTASDADAIARSKGYDPSFAEYSGESLPLTVHGGESYGVTVDVE